jgi:hypothetical protein
MVRVLMVPELEAELALEDVGPDDVEPVELEVELVVDAEPRLNAKNAAPAATIITTAIIMTITVVPTPGLPSR